MLLSTRKINRGENVVAPAGRNLYGMNQTHPMVEDRNIENLIKKAKKIVVDNYGHTEPERKWLSSTIDSYGDSENRITLYVLEGSPPKGYFLVSSKGWAQTLGLDGKPIRRIKL